MTPTPRLVPDRPSDEFRVVPVLPTPDMLRAGIEAQHQLDGEDGFMQWADAIYAAMIAAAPPAEAPAERGEWWRDEEGDDARGKACEFGSDCHVVPVRVAQAAIDKLSAALQRFVRDAEEVDVGGGDAVVTTCESLEIAKAALQAANGGAPE